MSRKIILIGGMPTADKSTIAEQLSAHFNLPWMSTDQVREIMKSAIDSKSDSALNRPVDMPAEEYLNKFTAEEIAQKEYNQSVATWPGISFMINNDWTWRRGFIMEGVNILPRLVAAEQKKRDNIQAVFISDQDTARTREVIYTRGLYTKASLYADDVKDKEIEWVRLFDDMIRAEATLHDLPVVELEKNDSDIDKLLLHLT